MRLIDTHFHLDYYQDHAHLYDQINRLKQYTLCVTNSPGIFYSCTQLYKETKYIKFALGYNPQRSIEEPFSRELFLREIQQTNYIGEVGLDFSKRFITTKDMQIDIFDFVCDIAAKQSKLLSVHSRKAEKETLNILLKNNVSRAIIHWYTGDIETLYGFLDAGYYFSINASMCTTQNGRAVIARIPTNRLLIESDGPFSKVSGRKYIPSRLSEIYLTVRETIGQNQLEDIIWNNFRELLIR